LSLTLKGIQQQQLVIKSSGRYIDVLTQVGEQSDGLDANIDDWNYDLRDLQGRNCDHMAAVRAWMTTTRTHFPQSNSVVVVVAAAAVVLSHVQLSAIIFHKLNYFYISDSTI
jgi:hypothetical protein